MSHDAKKMRLRWLYLPWAIAAVVFGGYYMLWRAGAAKIKSTVAEWAEDQRTAGMNIAYGPVRPAAFRFFCGFILMLPILRMRMSGAGEPKR